MSEAQTDPFDAVPAPGTGTESPTFPEMDDDSPTLSTDNTPRDPDAEDPDGEDADS
jgi:hypothetical protein